MPYICFKPEYLKAYIKSKRDKKITKEVYELLAILAFYKAHERVTKKKYLIAFSLKEKYEHEYNKENLDLTNEEIHELLNKKIKQDTIEDVILVSPKNGNLRELEKEGFHYQIKWFGLGNEKSGDTEALLNFLKKLKNKYTPSANRLIIHLENISNINCQTLVDWLNNNDFPFIEVFLIFLSSREIAAIIQLKPNNGAPGAEELTRDEIIN